MNAHNLFALVLHIRSHGFQATACGDEYADDAQLLVSDGDEIVVLPASLRAVRIWLGY